MSLGCALRYGRRFFCGGKVRNFSSAKETPEAPFDVFSALEAATSPKETPEQWMARQRTSLENTADCLYNEGDAPFVHNRLFVVRAPLCESVRNEIFHLHRTQPAAWTVRRLSMRFGVAMERIECIIDLKENEQKLVAAVSL